MKILLIAALSIIGMPLKKCGSNTTKINCFKGRLEDKGPCYNYTVKLLEGNIDTSFIMAHWKNERTDRDYTNVFALINPCHFPDTIKEGDEFFFALDSTTNWDCMVCMVYYPKPSKALRIKVLSEACNYK